MNNTYNSPNAQKRTTTFTFRIDTNVVDALRSECEDKQISLNTLVNQILSRYTEWDRFEQKVGMISLAKPVVAKLFERMSQEEVSDLAVSVGKNAVKDIAIFMGKEIDINSFLGWFEIRMRGSSAQLTRSTKNDVDTYVIKHDLGLKWSLYHKVILQLILQEFFRRSIDITISDTILKLNIQKE